MVITDVICNWLMIYVVEKYGGYDEFDVFMKEIEGALKNAGGVSLVRLRMR